MNLAVDIGNTNIKMAVFDKDDLKDLSLQWGDVEDILQKHKIRHAIVAKSGLNEEVVEFLKDKKVHTLILNNKLKLPIQILYETPETLGPDRIAGSVAARATFEGGNVLKVDFGTCITYDFIDEQGRFLGGGISPGMMMRFKAMHDYTAHLPLVDPMQFQKYELVGANTAASMAGGVINGIKNEVQGIINEYGERFGNLNVVATGGDAGLFVTMLKSKIFARPNLVLEGLNKILNYNT